jgi:hypothetical protein
LNNKCRKARITGWEDAKTDRRKRKSPWDDPECQFVSVEYTQPDGQRVEAVFDRCGWKRAPSEILEDVSRRLARPPIYFIGRRG